MRKKRGEHYSQCLTHIVGFIKHRGRKLTGKITYLTVVLNLTIISHYISQISMSVLFRTTHVFPMLTLCALTRMDRTIASAKMLSSKTAQPVKVQYNLVYKLVFFVA